MLFFLSPPKYIVLLCTEFSLLRFLQISTIYDPLEPLRAMEQHELTAFGNDLDSHRSPTLSAQQLNEDQAHPQKKDEGARMVDESAISRTFVIIISSLYLGTFLVALDTSIIGTALPAITSNFHALNDLAWYGNAYLLTFTALQPTCGKLYKVIDTKLMYLISIAVFESKTSSTFDP